MGRRANSPSFFLTVTWRAASQVQLGLHTGYRQPRNELA
jgi:hypothetical protein